MKRIFFLFLSTLAFFTCKQAGKDPVQTLNCYARFDSESNTFTSEAGLTDDQTRKPVEIAGGIRFQGMEMKLVPGYGLTYQYEYPAKFMSEQSFTWQDRQQARQTFKTTIDSISGISFGTGIVSLGKPATLSWNGPALGKGETLLFMWQNDASGANTKLEVSTTSGESRIDIPADKMKSLSPGKWSLYLVRKKLEKQTVGNLKVNAITEFYTRPITVTLIK